MVHFGVEFYGNGTLNTTVKCNGELDTACSAGNGQKGITPQHLFNSGVKMGRAGCSKFHFSQYGLTHIHTSIHPLLYNSFLILT